MNYLGLLCLPRTYVRWDVLQNSSYKSIFSLGHVYVNSFQGTTAQCEMLQDLIASQVKLLLALL